MTGPDDRPLPHTPSLGSVVVYRPERPDDDEEHRIGIVVGPLVPEPRSGKWWVGVRLSRAVTASADLDFIDVDSIVDTGEADDG
jgi:hypothetical protein